VSLIEILVWVLRGFGVLYLVGGLFGVRQAWFMIRAEPAMDQVLDMLDALKAEEQDAPPPAKRETDGGRSWWLLSGAALVTLAGAAMAAAHGACVGLLAVLIAHQLLYFVRQRGREFKAPNAEIAAEARAQPATINAFFGALLVTVFAAWLFSRGALI